MVLFFALSPSRAAPSSRERILDLIRDRPGVHKTALCQATGLAWGTVDYHLRLLEAAGQVSRQASGRAMRMFPNSLQADHQSLLAMLADEPATRIALVLRHMPGQGISALSQKLGLSAKVVRRHLGQMLRGGLLERQGTHRPRYRLSPDANSRLAEVSRALASPVSWPADAAVLPDRS